MNRIRRDPIRQLDILTFYNRGLVTCSRDRLPTGWSVGCGLNPRGHGEQVAELNPGHARVAERKGFGQILLGKDLLCQAIGKAAALFGQHDSAGNAGEHLADGIHIGVGFPVAAAKILLVDQVSVADDEQAAVLTAGLGVLKRLIQPGFVYAGAIADLRGGLKDSPTACGVGRGEIDLFALSRARSQIQEWQRKQEVKAAFAGLKHFHFCSAKGYQLARSRPTLHLPIWRRERNIPML